MLLALSRVHQAGKDVFACQLLEIKKDFLKRHPRRKPPQHITHRDAGVAHARLAETDFGVDADVGSHDVHAQIVNLRDSLRLEFVQGCVHYVGRGLKQARCELFAKIRQHLFDVSPIRWRHCLHWIGSRLVRKTGFSPYSMDVS